MSSHICRGSIWAQLHILLKVCFAFRSQAKPRVLMSTRAQPCIMVVGIALHSTQAYLYILVKLCGLISCSTQVQPSHSGQIYLCNLVKLWGLALRFTQTQPRALATGLDLHSCCRISLAFLRGLSLTFWSSYIGLASYFMQFQPRALVEVHGHSLTFYASLASYSCISSTILVLFWTFIWLELGFCSTVQTTKSISCIIGCETSRLDNWWASKSQNSY